MVDLIDISEYPNDPVDNINRNPYRFTYIRESLTSDSSSLMHIDLPESLKEHSLFKGFVSFSKTKRFIKLNCGSQGHYARALENLIDYFSVDDNHKLLEDNDDRAVSVHYLNHLSTNVTDSQDTIYRNFSSIKSVLTYCNDRARKDFDHDCHDCFLDDLLTQMPRLSRPESLPKPVFTDVFDVEHSDDEILISMRHVLTWFMLKMQEIRRSFLNDNSELAESIFAAFNNDKSPYQNRVMTMVNSSNTITKENNGLYLDALLKLKNPILNEMLVLASRNLGRMISSGERYSTWQIRRELGCQFPNAKQRKHQRLEKKGKKALLTRYDSLLLGDRQNASNQSVFPIGCMFTSSLSERRAVAWLWASERIQATGHDKVTFEGVLFDKFDNGGEPTELQIKFPKPRSGRYFKTPIYTKDEDPLFDVYYNYYLLRKSEGDYFSSIERSGYLAPSKWNKLFLRPAAICQTTHLPLLLLGMPGTVMYNACLTEVKAAKPFLDVLAQSVESSTLYRDMRC